MHLTPSSEKMNKTGLPASMKKLQGSALQLAENSEANMETQSQNTSSKLTRIGTALNRRTSKFTPETADLIVEKVVEGLPLSAAAPLAGVHGRTAKTWYDKGEDDPEGPFGMFTLALQAAEAISMEDTITDWRELGLETKQWTAFATFAERRWPEIFAKKQDKGPQVTVNVGIVEGRLQELHAKGEIVYSGG